MRLSIIIPAFNEAQLIERCLRSITDALTAHSASGVTGELIVADNNSTDSTACLAKQAGAQVVFEPVNQIGRARNAGAAVATGDWLLFLDADSVLSPELLGDILHVIKSKTHVGCGSTLSMPGLPWWAYGILRFWTQTSILLHWAAGALFVCRRDAFVEVGGFSQELYALEEIDLSKRIRKWGRQRNLEFTILTTHPLHTSPRKISLYSAREIAGQILRMLLNRRRTLTDKKHLSVWYDGRR